MQAQPISSQIEPRLIHPSSDGGIFEPSPQKRPHETDSLASGAEPEQEVASGASTCWCWLEQVLPECLMDILRWFFQDPPPPVIRRRSVTWAEGDALTAFSPSPRKPVLDEGSLEDLSVSSAETGHPVEEMGEEETPPEQEVPLSNFSSSLPTSVVQLEAAFGAVVNASWDKAPPKKKRQCGQFQPCFCLTVAKLSFAREDVRFVKWKKSYDGKTRVNYVDDLWQFYSELPKKGLSHFEICFLRNFSDPVIPNAEADFFSLDPNEGAKKPTYRFDSTLTSENFWAEFPILQEAGVKPDSLPYPTS